MRRQPALRACFVLPKCQLQHLLQLVVHELNLGADDDLASVLAGTDDTGSTGSLDSLLVNLSVKCTSLFLCFLLFCYVFHFYMHLLYIFLLFLSSDFLNLVPIC